MSYKITRRHVLALGAQAAAVAAASRLSNACVLQGAAASGEYRAAVAAVEGYIPRHLAELHASGLTLALADANGGIHAAAFGMSDVKGKKPVTTDHLFQIGSITKSFTALLLLQLRDEGKLDFHKPAAEYLPWLKVETKWEPFTIHHLLTHSSGLPGNAPLFFDGKLWTGFAPGEQFHYCNLGYTILGHLIEGVTGKSYAEVIRTRIFEPLGMTASEPLTTPAIRDRMALSYDALHDDRPLRRGGPMKEASQIIMDHASGSICSTPADMAKYMQMIIRGGEGLRGRLVSKEAFADFVKPHIKAPSFGAGASYGYGLAISELDGRRIVRHTGGMVSFSSAMQIDMDTAVGAFASVNASLQGYRPNAVAVYALQTMFAAKNRKAIPDAPKPNVADEIEKAADYAGIYTAPNGRKLDVRAEGKHLFLFFEGQRVTLEARGADTFLVRHPDDELFALRFTREPREKGPVVEAAYGSNWYAGEKYTGPKTFDYPKEWEQYVGHYKNDDPWEGNARVVLRKGRLWINGSEPLYPLPNGMFRVGEEEHSPERARFTNIVNGKAQRVMFSEVAYIRTLAP